jgi:hypothetical protein
VGEIQKAYNALAGILKRDADEIYSTIDKLRTGPVGMPRDFEWNQFVNSDPHFVNPNVPLRRLEEIEYPGKHHPATTEVRAGMLERKSKYLKSYTPGWYVFNQSILFCANYERYVLSPTHLHEFKSADRIYTQPPVMSLYLPDQKLGSHSQPGSSSHKFVLKGRQTGSMHRGHTWVFRAESYDTMLAWYEDVKALTETTGEQRNAFVRRHVRSVSQGSARSVSSDGGLEEDEADEVPYSANQSMTNAAAREETPQRPSPGGRFPSDIQIDRNLQAPLSPSSGSSEINHDITTAAGGLQSDGYGYPAQPMSYDSTQQPQPQNSAMHPATQTVNAYQNNADYAYPPQQLNQQQYPPSTQAPYINSAPINQQAQPLQMPAQPSQPPPPTHEPAAIQPSSGFNPSGIERHDSTYGDWLGGAAVGAGGGVLGTAAYNHYHHDQGQNAGGQGPVEQPTQAAPISHAKAIPTPIPTSIPMSSEPDSLATTPATSVDRSFLDGAEAVPATASPKAVNGGPVAVGSGFPIHPRRQNTDFSVSELHVPGEFPKTVGA